MKQYRISQAAFGLQEGDTVPTENGLYVLQSPFGRMGVNEDALKLLLVFDPVEPAEDWQAKYRELRIQAVAKNAGLLRAIGEAKRLAETWGQNHSADTDIIKVCEKAQSEFGMTRPETGILAFSEAQPDFSAERAELVTALNKIVYHYRNGRGKKLAKAIWNADKLIQEYV
jgi:hypothetical protein